MQKNFSMLLAAATVVSQASAADLPRKAPPYMPPPVPALTWTGCYLGGNIGGAWANVEVSDVPTGVTASRSNSGFAGGGQIGCDYQMGAWVIGIRNMFDGTSIRETTPFSDGVFAGSFDSGSILWPVAPAGSRNLTCCYTPRVVRRGPRRLSPSTTRPA